MYNTETEEDVIGDNYIEITELTDEINNESSSLLEIRKKINDILREDFDEIYNFFLQILSQSYNYVILISRRCQVLYQIFFRFLLIDGALKKSTPHIISSQSLPYYMKTLKNRNVAIVDDILIHGRAIKNLFRSISKESTETQIKIHVYMADHEIDFIEDKIKKCIQAEYAVSKEEWRTLSNKIVCSIFAANEPYTSFVPSYFHYKNRYEYDTLQSYDNIKGIEIASCLQKHYGVSAHYFFESSFERQPVFRWLSAGEGVRAYWKEDISKLTIIPYVFLRSMSIKEAQGVFGQLICKLPPSMENVISIFETNTEEEMYGYKIRLLSCLLSSAYWIDFKQRNNIQSKCYLDINTLQESFGKHIAEELKYLTPGVVEDILNISEDESYTSEESSYCVKEIEELADAIDNSFSLYDDIGDIIKNYIHKAWYIDEKKATIHEDRYNGLTIESFINRATKKQISSQEVLASLVSAWDNGLATANYIYDAEQGIIGSFIMPGEHGFTVPLERYPYLMKMLIYVSKNIVRKSSKETFEKDEEYRNRKIQILIEFLESYSKEHNIIDYSPIKNIINDEKGYLNSWNQTLVLNAALPFDTKKDDEFVINFIKNMRCGENDGKVPRIHKNNI